MRIAPPAVNHRSVAASSRVFFLSLLVKQRYIAPYRQNKPVILFTINRKLTVNLEILRAFELRITSDRPSIVDVQVYR